MLNFNFKKTGNMHGEIILLEQILVCKQPFDKMIYGLMRGLFIREIIYWIVIMYVQGGLPDWMTESVVLIFVRILDIIVRGSFWNSV